MKSAVQNYFQIIWLNLIKKWRLSIFMSRFHKYYSRECLAENWTFCWCWRGRRRLCWQQYCADWFFKKRKLWRHAYNTRIGNIWIYYLARYSHKRHQVIPENTFKRTASCVSGCIVFRQSARKIDEFPSWFIINYKNLNLKNNILFRLIVFVWKAWVAKK